jgi:hypothetical protein
MNGAHAEMKNKRFALKKTYKANDSTNQIFGFFQCREDCFQVSIYQSCTRRVCQLSLFRCWNKQDTEINLLLHYSQNTANLENKLTFLANFTVL